MDLNVLLDKLEKFIKTESVIGQPYQVGNVTLIPVMSVGFGVGGGGGVGKDEKGNDGSGNGAGLGCKLTPITIVVVKGDEVSAIPLSSKGSMEKILEMVPDIVTKLNLNCKGKEQE